MAEFTLDQKKAIAIAEAKMKLEQETAQAEDTGGAVSFLNKGLAQIAGAPVDATAAVLRMIPGMDRIVPAESFGGAKTVRGGMEAIGAPTPDRDPETLPEFVGQTLGEAAGFAVPMAKGAQLLSKAPATGQAASGVIRPMAQSINSALVQNPLATLATEAAAGTGAGVGRAIAEAQDMGAGGSALTELAGGVAGGLSPTVLGGRALAKLTGATGRQAKKTAFTFTEKGAFDRASARVQDVVSDPSMAAQKIDELKGSNLLPAARTDDPGLMTLEEAVFSRDPAESTRIAMRTSESIDNLVQSVRRSGETQSPRKFLQARKERLNNALDARVENAAEDAVKALESGDPLVSKQSLSDTVRDNLESALSDAKAQEAMLWGAVPENAKVPVRSVKRKFAKLKEKLPDAQRKDMPASAEEIIGKRGKGVKTTIVRELDGLYKKLGEEATIARSANEFNKARIAEELRESILDDMANPIGNEEVRQSLDAARSFSKSVKDKFQKGTVGRILGHAREGGAKLPSELTLESTLGVGGTKGRLAAEAISKASGDELTLDAMGGFLRRQFEKAAVEDGIVSPQKANTFFKQNAEALDMFPAVRDQLRAAKSAEDVSRRVASRAEAFKTKLQRPSVSTTGLFLNAPVDREIKAVMSSGNSKESMASLARMARKDKSGKVLEGLRTGMNEWLINSARAGKSVDLADRSIYNGGVLESMLQTPHIRETFAVVNSPAQMKSLDNFAKEMKLLNRQLKAKRSRGVIINDLPSKMLELPVRYLGAKTATLLTSGNAGTSLQAAQMGSKEAQRLLRKMNVGRAEQMIVDAMEDPELMKSLLLNTRTSSTQARRKAGSKIQAWLQGPGKRLIEDDEEESQ